ncbi:LuxR family transcriptional regulator [Streptomyces cucumeris]|uniref:LuxR family transcriptional regulator n=1 Tax=Streptomyces cucumeris TaxID=2962890 RepID=UPI003D71B5A4
MNKQCTSVDLPTGGDSSLHDDPACFPDEFGEALADIRRLIDTAVGRYRAMSSLNQLIEPLEPGQETLREAIIEVIAAAERSLDVVISAEAVRTEQLCADLQSLLLAMGKKCRVRVLVNQAMLDQRLGDERRGEGYPMDIRVAPMPFLEAVIADGRAAVMRTDRGGQTSRVRAKVVTDALLALFGSAWRTAAPLGTGAGLVRPERSPHAGRILRRLYAGVTDEVAARELRISVRTYRRYVAEILDSLGTKSRFQAGVLAADAGLLSTRPPAGRDRAVGRVLPEPAHPLGRSQS